MHLGMMATEDLRVCPKDGGEPISTKGRVAGTIILIPDAKIPLLPGDFIERSLPSGIVERFVVVDPGFHGGVHGIPSHYQVKFRRADAEPPKALGHAIHVTGPNARVNIGSSDHSTNTVQHFSAGTDAGALVEELKRLRIELLARAGDDAENYSAIGAVASAETATREGDEAKASRVLRTLGKAGMWVLSTAKELGLQVASEYIKAQIG